MTTLAGPVTPRWTWSSDNVRPLTHAELEQLRDMMRPTRPASTWTATAPVAAVYVEDADAVTETATDEDET